ncbi:copper resistance CopC/CopD family protein [Streptomyces pinistramenti]|uniref:copper resistance CopC/CopD family protein n=1 Tax=Streptomyces pinistramenti TaxID=2884812 RepID=UPI001D077F45|nr:copper resistance protein CopC [Streptomyces pinistramenti]MCB5911557.1 copper resistance protein CopC [Streptomyces pinistramenti]
MITTAPRRPRPVALRLLVVVAALFGVLFGGAAPAFAHAALTGSTPAQGAVVDHAPEQVALSFSEGVAMSDDSIRVLDPKGKRVDRGKLRDLCSGETVKYGTGLPPGLPDGTYTVAWQAISADSHPVSGAFTFSVGAPSATKAPLPQQEAGGGLVGALYGIARYLAYAGFTLLVGGAAFVLACRPAASGVRSVQRLVVRGWALLTAATLAMLLLRGPYTGSGDLADVFDLGGLKAALETKPGAALLARLLLLAAAAVFLAVLFGAYERARRADTDGAAQPSGETDEARGHVDGGRLRRLTAGLSAAGLVVAAGLATTWAAAEHASTGLQPGIAMPVDVLHLLAFAAWLGGLAALLVSLYRGPVVERTAVRRFSRLAFGSVLVLVATGIYQSWRQVGTLHALTDTTYGLLLLLKVALVVVLVGIAWTSRRWTARLREAGTETAAATVPVGVAAASGAGVPDVPETSAASDGPDSPGSSDASDAAPADPARTAQLARQRAALDSAKVRRLRDADPERRGLRRSVLAEASVAVVLLVVATVLTATEPARTEEAVKAGEAGQSADANQPRVLTIPFDTGGAHGKGTARIDLDPGRSGSGNQLRVRIADPSGATMNVPEVKVSFTLRAKKLGPLPVVPEHVGKGHWSASGVQLPVPGQWQLALLVRTSDVDQVTETRNVKID